MAILNAQQRRASETLPGGRYPIPDKGHAKMAIAYINKGGLSPEQKMEVMRKAHMMLNKSK